MMLGLGRAGGRRCWGVGVGVGVWAVVIAQACLACLAIRPGSCSGRLQGAGPLLRDVAVPLARADRAHWGCMANQRRVGSTTGGAQRPQSGSALCRLTHRPRLVAEVLCSQARCGLHPGASASASASASTFAREPRCPSPSPRRPRPRPSRCSLNTYSLTDLPT